MPARESWIVRVAKFVEETWPSWLSGAVPFLLALSALLPADWTQSLPLGGPLDRTSFIWISAILGGASAVIVYRRERSLARLRAAVSRSDRADGLIRELMLDELGEIAGKLHFATDERITLFAPTSGGFEAVARCAARTSWQAVPRSPYPLKQGCIGQAWEHREAIEVGLPDPLVDYAGWQSDQATKWNVPPAVSANFRMRTRFYAAFAVGASLTRPPLGVIVYESVATFAMSSTPARTGNAPILNPEPLRRLKHPQIALLLELLSIVRAQQPEAEGH
jgi:hypothetical protein